MSWHITHLQSVKAQASLYHLCTQSMGVGKDSKKVHTVKPVSNGHSQKDHKIGFQHQLSLNAVQKYCGMLQGEHSAILSTFIKLPFVIKIFVLPIFERPFYTGFTIPPVTLLHVSNDCREAFEHMQ